VVAPVTELGHYPNRAFVRPVDNGFTQRGASGPAGRVDKPGSHWAIEINFPPMPMDTARRLNADLTSALSEGARIEVPLLGVDQGMPGSPVVDGADQTGTTLNIRGLTPNYATKKGFWLHIEDGDGNRCLHQVAAQGIADAAGDLALTIWPALWRPFADGDAINLSDPTIEGAIDGFSGWELSPDRLCRQGGSIVIEESA
jgi:hypothetical protein